MNGCTQCISYNTCNACTVGTFIYNGLCIKACPSGFYNNITSNSCTACDDRNCDVCESNTCRTCKADFELFDKPLDTTIGTSTTYTTICRCP